MGITYRAKRFGQEMAMSVLLGAILGIMLGYFF